MTGYTFDDEWTGPFVDGEWRTNADAVVEIQNPATEDVLVELSFGTKADVDDAYESALEAAPDWAGDPQRRSRILADVAARIEENAEEIHRLISMESGGTIHKARQEAMKTIGQIEHARELIFRAGHTETPSQVPGKRNEIRREPAGVVGVITPWNVPLKLAFQSIAPALALGNPVVLKPAPDTPISGGLVIARLFEEAGAPPGVVNVVPGYGTPVGERVVSHPGGDVISFTGSSAVGREVGTQAIADFKEVMLELGGNNPHIILEDAELDQAVEAGAFATFGNQGQACISINRHLVHTARYEEYVERMVSIAEDLRLGDPLDPATQLGPVINEQQRDRILEFIQGTVDRGATLETGGGSDGLFVEPTVVSDVRNDMPLACNEHFGPVAPVIPFSDDDEAIALANDTEYGLSASVHSSDTARAQRIARSIESGMVHINDQTVNSEPTAPFGGVKASGIGRHNGQWAIEKYTTVRWISYQDTPRSYPL